MTHSLPPNPDISRLKKQAKRLLKDYRENAPGAISRVNSGHPKPSEFTGLRDAQLVVARGYGFKDWADLSDTIIAIDDANKTLKEKADLFLKLGCVYYSGSDFLRNYQRAQQLLTLSPEIAEQNFYTALVANNLECVNKYLKMNPTLAQETGGPMNWPVLLYCTYSRITESPRIRNSLNIARRLLEEGSNPNSYVLLQDTYRFTALTGAMGEGEQGVHQPPHQYADEMVELLLDAGANVNESQGLYNTMFTQSVDKWLALLISKGLNSDSKINWNAGDGEENLKTLNYQLAIAVDQGAIDRVQMLLDAGANANTANSYSGKPIHTHAQLKGHKDIKILLEKHGAHPVPLSIEDQFRVACAENRVEDVEILLKQYPALLMDASLLHDAADLPVSSIYQQLLDLGFDVNAQISNGRTILHHFALNNESAHVDYLLKKGARIDIRDSTYNSTAVGFAAHAGSNTVLELLLERSNSFLDCVSCAYVQRAACLLAKNPERIFDRTPEGNTALHAVGLWLQEEPDVGICVQFIDMLLGAGADLKATNNDQQNPVDYYRSKGADNMAELLVGRSRQ